MTICAICNTELKNTNGLAKHITNQHSISKEEYYRTYINEVSSICVCGTSKVFRNLGEGYREFCSAQCRSNNLEPTSYWANKSQPQSMIDKRRSTMVDRYGVANGFLTKHAIAEKYKGFVCRSTYEKNFVDFAEQYGYTLTVPPRISYEFDGKSRYFYPDFYIEEFDLIVEIKSTWSWNLHLDMNIAKQVCTIEQGYDIIFLDEENGINDSTRWNDLNEYLLSLKGP